jgi:hypothetical protein
MEPTKDGMCFTVAEAEIIGVPRDVAEANARLIAAAPDLLAACKALLTHGRSAFEDDEGLWPSACESAKAAISKAEWKDA